MKKKDLKEKLLTLQQEINKVAKEVSEYCDTYDWIQEKDRGNKNTNDDLRALLSAIDYNVYCITKDAEEIWLQSEWTC